MSQDIIDWAQVRSNYPACENSAYFLSAAVGPLHKKVFAARLKHLEMMHLKGDFHWEESVELMDQTRSQMAELLEASPDDIGFGYNTSHNMSGLASVLKGRSVNRKIVVLDSEFPATVTPWRAQGFQSTMVSIKSGQDPVQKILEKVESETAAVVCSHVQYSTGLKIDIDHLGEELERKGIPFVVNGTQSFGVFPISVKKCKAVAVVSSCHKWFNGGYGCSVLYMAPELRKEKSWPFKGWLSVEDPSQMDPMNLDFKDSTSVIETGVPAFNIMAGISVAVEVVLSLGVNNIAKRVLCLSDKLCEKLQTSGVEILSSRDDNHDIDRTQRSGTVSIKCIDPETWVSELEKRNIFVSARSGAIRIAVSYFNNEKDLDQLVEALRELQNQGPTQSNISPHIS